MKIYDPEFTGSIQFLAPVEVGITGSIFGSASYALTASFALNGGGGGVTTVAGTADEILVNGGTPAVGGAVTLSLPSNVNLGANSSFTSTGLTGSLLGTASRASSITPLSQDVQVTGDVRITGSLFIKDDLTVLGTSSILYVTSSQLDISTNIITVNTDSAVNLRFGGLAVIDSGSSPKQSGSILYDSVQDEWIFVHRGASNVVTSSHFLVGPETYNNLGNETYIPQNQLIKSIGNEHVTGSRISDDGTTINLAGNTKITGSLHISASSNTVELTIIGQTQQSGTLFVTASDNNIAINSVGNTIITGSLIVSGTSGAGVFSKGILLAGTTAEQNVTNSFWTWRAPFPARVVNIYAIKSGSSNVVVNARPSGSATLHLGTALTVTTNNTWQGGVSPQNTDYSVGQSLELIVSGGAFWETTVQVDFIKL